LYANINSQDFGSKLGIKDGNKSVTIKLDGIRLTFKSVDRVGGGIKWLHYSGTKTGRQKTFPQYQIQNVTLSLNKMIHALPN
jgi:hypothetical protein